MRWIALPMYETADTAYIQVSSICKVQPHYEGSRLSLTSGEQFSTSASPEQVLKLMQVRVDYGLGHSEGRSQYVERQEVLEP